MTSTISPPSLLQQQQEDTPPHLSPSELGTKEYWDALYAADLLDTTPTTTTTFTNTVASAPEHGSTDHKPADVIRSSSPVLASSPSSSTSSTPSSASDAAFSPTDSPANEPLQGWFSNVHASSKILQYFHFSTPSSRGHSSASPTFTLDRSTTTFLDLGTGNGEMLFLLREGGAFQGDMLGVDYSPEGVELCRREARARAERKGGLEEEGKLEFEVWDIMATSCDDDDDDDGGGDGPRREGQRRGNSCSAREKVMGPDGRGWDVVLDKGTFDAVSLSAEMDPRTGKRLCEGYAAQVEGLVKEDGGLLLVTSCNWTEEELKVWFLKGGGFEVVGRIEYPVFRFGGRTGSSVCSVCFRRKGRRKEMDEERS